MSTVTVDVKALAELARLEVSEEELARLERQLPDILEFVKAIEAAPTAGVSEKPVLENVMRPDTDPHESGTYTADVLAAAPQVRDNRVVVKQVISRKANQPKN